MTPGYYTGGVDMHSDTVTIFNYYEDKKKDIAYWYPTTLNNVEAQVSEGLSVIKTGNENANSLWLSIPLISVNNELYADGVKYLKNKRYAASEDKSDCFTVKKNDFVVLGAYESDSVINDDDYKDGFFQYMKSTHDDVYNINTIDEYKGIRHIEIGGR